MAKILHITQCSQCCHQTKHMVLCEDGYEIVDSATCDLTGNKLDYMHISNFKLRDDLAFPNDCPLGDVYE